jgi:hypothetical protein
LVDQRKPAGRQKNGRITFARNRRTPHNGTVIFGNGDRNEHQSNFPGNVSVSVLGSLFIIAGAGLSVATCLHDLKRWRLVFHAPQAAPSRVAPEVHFLACVLAGIGSTINWSLLVGLVVSIAQAMVVYAVAPLIVEKIAQRMTPPSESPF